jgi:RNA polymerase sigma-70 factor, ECF subfamily
MLARHDSTHPSEWDWTSVRALCLRETRRVLGASSAADDAAQEAVIRVWRHRGRCRTPARPDPWITTIARREAFRTLSQRSERSLDEHVETADPCQQTAELADSLDLWRAIGSLNGPDRRLLIGHYWQDLPNSELALELGIAESTVRVRLHRLRRQLRHTLGE